MQNMPFICTVFLRLEVTGDANFMKVSMHEYANYLSAMEKWLYNAGHVAVVPQEIKVFESMNEEIKILSAWNNVLNPCLTARDWLTALFTRLAVLTRRGYSACIETARHCCGVSVTMMTLVLDNSHSNFLPS